MKTLIKIQKTYHVFEILSGIAMVVSFLGTFFALVGMGCCVIWQQSGTLGFGQEVMRFTGTESLEPAICELLSDAVFALTDGILFLLTWRYFKAEQGEGTPFTHSGANRVKSLGVKIIVMPIVATIISTVIYGCFGVEPSAEWNNAASVILGIILILFAQVFHYGAELEKEEKR